MSNSPATAFISYSREDSEFALRLARDLRAAGASVWIDQLDIRPGTPWDNAIEAALLDAPFMLAVLSPTSVRSDNVRDEISYALTQGKIVIPVLYRDCVIPLRLERKQYIDFRAEYARGLTALLQHLRISNPNPAVLEQAAEEDAVRKVAWQAREAEARRLSHLSELDNRQPQRQEVLNKDDRQAATLNRPNAQGRKLRAFGWLAGWTLRLMVKHFWLVAIVIVILAVLIYGISRN